MSSYISYLSPASWTRAQKNKSDLEKTNPTNPVLKDEDEEFLTKITSEEGVAPPLPERKDGGLSKIEPSVIGDDGEEKDVSGEQKEKAAEVAKNEGLEGPAVVPEKAVEVKDEKVDEAKDGKVDEAKDDEAKDDKADEAKDDKKNETSEENKEEDKVDLEKSDVVDGAAVKTDKASEEQPNVENPVVEQEDKDIHTTDDSKPAKEEDKEDTKSDDKSEDKTETTSEDKAEENTEAKSEDKTDDKPEEKTDDKPAEKDAKPTKKWASYIPSIPSIPSIPKLTKKKDAASTSTKEEPKAEEQKTEDTPSSPTSPKAKKAKKDPFPTQEEAEATTTAGTSQSSQSSQPSTEDSKQPSSPTQPIGRQTDDVSNPNTRTWASYIPNISRKDPSDSLDSAIKKGKAKEDPLKNPDGSQTDDEKEVSVLLDNLNLSAINNRVFSFSQQSQSVYEDFTVVLKDIVNGGPTAYEDLEKLIKDNEGQLDSMFGNMPPFVQTLVKSLPSKFAGSLGPEVLAAMSEKPGNDLKVQQAVQASSSSGIASLGESSLKVPEGKKKQKRKIPGVKALVSEQGAVASMLRSILAFLKTRFPAFVTGTNVLMSLAVFILLFVFWYCHKRGKEVRLLKEKESASADVSEIEESDSDLDESNVLEKAQRDYPEVEADKWIKEKEAEGKDEKSTEGETEEKTEAKDETAKAETADAADDKGKEEEVEQEDEDIHTTSTSKPAKEEDAEKAT